MKRATAKIAFLQGIYRISIHALVKRATQRSCNCVNTNQFQSTPSWRGRPVVSFLWLFDFLFQSTPSWRGRLGSKTIIIARAIISIHALVKRATIQSNRLPFPISISIHALVKRATTGYSFFAVRACHFNPRPREEGDCLFANGLSFGILFQSTPSWRGRQTRWQTEYIALIFQSTPSWRGRRCDRLTDRSVKRFQSTPSWRGRPFLLYLVHPLLNISIHALVKRATLGFTSSEQISTISIHALVKRATFRLVGGRLFISISIHALVKRATAARQHKGLGK